MEITLTRAESADCSVLHALQVACFRELLEKYRDTDTNPGAEPPEKTAQRLAQPETGYYFIRLGDKNIGALRVCDYGELAKLKQIYILPEFQGHGYAQKAIALAESLYPSARRWELDTILQEEKLCPLYEKMGYRKTGKTKNIRDGMDLVFFAKGEKCPVNSVE